MTDDEHPTEIKQAMLHLNGIADVLAARMASLPTTEAETLLEQELVSLALIAKRLNAKALGYNMREVVRARVAKLLASR